jgi:hypothetical protein
MSLVKVAGLLEPGALVEIEGTAILPIDGASAAPPQGESR